jgi:primosomal protein N'
VANGPCVHHRFIRTLIAIAGASSPLADGLTYEVPAQTLPGTLLRVPLRKQWAEGIVIGEEDRLSDVTARAVGNVLHAEPLLPLAHVFTARWMAGYYRCSLKKDGRGFSPKEVLHMIRDVDTALSFFRMDGWLNTLCAYPNPELPVRVKVAGRTDDSHVSHVVVECENWYPPPSSC